MYPKEGCWGAGDDPLGTVNVDDVLLSLQIGIKGCGLPVIASHKNYLGI